MINFSTYIIIEFIIGIFIWWMAVYLFTQSPFNRLIQLISGIFLSISIYFSSDILLEAAFKLNDLPTYIIILRSTLWAIYLPTALLYHASLQLFSKVKVKKWQIFSIYFTYTFAFLCIYLEQFTNLTRNYNLITSLYNGDLNTITGSYFWLNGSYLTAISILILINFYLLYKNQKKNTTEWYKYFWPFLGLLLSTLMAPFIILSYYNIIPHSVVLSGLSFVLLIIPVLYSVIKYNLFISDTRIIFGKNFLYSSLTILMMIFLLALIFVFSGVSILNIKGLIFSYLLFYFIIASHPIYNWLKTFSQDLLYNLDSGLSVVNDQEISEVLKYYNQPSKLENNTLLRLNLVNKLRPQISVDNLREVTKEAIEYFKPSEEPHRRTKQNLKYQLLRMLAFDQAEEGQILWELGFEEYPVKIMSQERRLRSPLFETKSPSDYTYTSRNAYLALKKEAIHDITWRISYLEKLAKKKLF